MKQILTLVMAMATGAAAFGQPYSWNSTNNVAGGLIPDNNASGLASTIGVGGLVANIQNVTVSLDITGGYNGDLYAYLAGPNGGFAVLLNRSGVTNGNAGGYADSGYNVTFDDSGSNPDIHNYQNVVNPNGSVSGGVLTGTWGSDGENINPQSPPSSFLGSSTATLESFDTGSIGGNGTWTLFLADLAAGDQSTIVSWSLDITTVPEPASLPLAAMGIALIVARKMRR
jgi:subtilisin-like proprotein convertase family protein